MEFKKYETTLTWPVKPVAPRKEKFDFTIEGVTAYNKAMEEYKEKVKEFEAKRSEYYKDVNEKNEMFKHDLEKVFYVDKLPREILDAVYSKAYNDGHSYGNEEIYNKYTDLLSILDAVEKYIK